jgi:sorbitol/mannitol transport system permease protein
MAFQPAKRTKDLLMWMLSTKMMPAAGVLIPMYLLFRSSGLLDTRIGITVVLIGLAAVTFNYFDHLARERGLIDVTSNF